MGQEWYVSSWSGKTTFDSIQDFYLDTKALVTNIIPIRDNVTNEVVTDYNLFNDLPRIYVKIDNPNAEIEQTKPIQQESRGLRVRSGGK